MIEHLQTFFRNLFSKKHTKYLEASNPIESTDIKENVTNDFKNHLLIYTSKDDTVLELQQKFKKGDLLEEDLTKEQWESLSNLYQKQIAKTEQSIKLYKSKIESIRLQLVSKN